MIITEYDAVDEFVLAQCDRCGYEKVIPYPSTRQMLALRCDCPTPPSERIDSRKDDV